MARRALPARHRRALADRRHGTAGFSGLRAGPWVVSVTPRSGWRTTTGPDVTATVGVTPADAAVGVARLPAFTVRPVDDTDGDGVADAGEPTVGGLLVELAPEGGTTTRQRTDGEGATVDPSSRPSRVRVLRPDSGLPWRCTSATVATPTGSSTASCDADGWVSVPSDTREVVALGSFTDGVVSTRVFDDGDRDGRQDSGEAPLADWPVVLRTTDTHAEVVRTTTDTTGTAGLVAPPGLRARRPATVRDGAVVATQGASEGHGGRAAHVMTTAGWVQPGSVSVGFFHDLDQDGVRESATCHLRTGRSSSWTPRPRAWSPRSSPTAPDEPPSRHGRARSTPSPSTCRPDGGPRHPGRTEPCRPPPR